MKRIFTILAVVMVFAFTLVPAFAAEGEVSEPVAVYTPVTVTVEDNTSIAVRDADVWSALRGNFTTVLVDIFGEYTPRTQTVTTYFADGTSINAVEIVPGVAGLDWVWLASVTLFGVVIYCILRMIGGVLKWN